MPEHFVTSGPLIKPPTRCARFGVGVDVGVVGCEPLDTVDWEEKEDCIRLGVVLAKHKRPYESLLLWKGHRKVHRGQKHTGHKLAHSSNCQH